MSVPAAYLTVIVIWSTTPLAIQWSSIGVGYEFGVAARMLIGLLALLLIIRLRGLPLPWSRHARTVYLVSGLSLFIAMSLVYWSAQFIPSGWISVIFGLAPLITSAFASFILHENNLTTGPCDRHVAGTGRPCPRLCRRAHVDRCGLDGCCRYNHRHRITFAGRCTSAKTQDRHAGDLDHRRQPYRGHSSIRLEFSAIAQMA